MVLDSSLHSGVVGGLVGKIKQLVEGALHDPSAFFKYNHTLREVYGLGEKQAEAELYQSMAEAGIVSYLLEASFAKLWRHRHDPRKKLTDGSQVTNEFLDGYAYLTGPENVDVLGIIGKYYQRIPSVQRRINMGEFSSSSRNKEELMITQEFRRSTTTFAYGFNHEVYGFDTKTTDLLRKATWEYISKQAENSQRKAEPIVQCLGDVLFRRYASEAACGYEALFAARKEAASALFEHPELYFGGWIGSYIAFLNQKVDADLAEIAEKGNPGATKYYLPQVSVDSMAGHITIFSRMFTGLLYPLSRFFVMEGNYDVDLSTLPDTNEAFSGLINGLLLPGAESVLQDSGDDFLPPNEGLTYDPGKRLPPFAEGDPRNRLWEEAPKTDPDMPHLPTLPSYGK